MLNKTFPLFLLFLSFALLLGCATTAPVTINDWIALISPTAGATHVTTEAVVKAVFGKDIKAASINTTNFRVSSYIGNAPGVASYDATTRTATFTPAGKLPTNTTLTATISGSIEDTSSNKMGTDYTWQFTTGVDASSPQVLEVYPLNGATAVPTNTLVTARFNTDFTSTLFTTSTFSLECALGYNGPYAVVAYNTATRTATLTQAYQLLPNTTYTARVSGALYDLVGNHLGNDYVWTFTTAATSAVSSLAAGLYHAEALCANGLGFEWGVDVNGRKAVVGASGGDLTIPGLIYGPSSISAIDAGEGFTVALSSDGTIWTWGNNTWGQCGRTSSTASLYPGQISGLTSGKAVSAGTSHGLAAKTDGSLWAWGINGYGQLGDGSTTNRTAPVQITGISNVTAVSGGFGHTLALDGSGVVWAWGSNSYGCLGDNSGTQQNSPVNGILTGVQAIAAGYYTSIALKTNGTVWTWGRNTDGELGINSATSESRTPVQVPTLSGMTAIAAGNSGGKAHMLAVKSDGTVWAWGYNGYGQLGNGTTTNSSIPVQVTGLTNIVAVAGGGTFSLALQSNGTVWAWGRDYYGALGDGKITDSTSYSTTPVKVGGFSSY